jgi:hypothetical protein
LNPIQPDVEPLSNVPFETNSVAAADPAIVKAAADVTTHAHFSRTPCTLVSHPSPTALTAGGGERLRPPLSSRGCRASP